VGDASPILPSGPGAHDTGTSPQAYIDGVILAVDQISREAGAILDAAAAVHDVLNVLSPARAYAQLAVKNPTDVNVLLASAQATLAAVARCEAILSSVLARDPSHPASCDVFHVVHTCAAGQQTEVQHQASERELTAAISSVDLDHVVSNLIQNARRANESSTVLVETLAAGAWIEIHIIDNGPGVGSVGGITTQAESRGSSRTPGAGVGLWKSYQLIRAAGGELLALKNVPRGTRMVVRLPRAA